MFTSTSSLDPAGRDGHDGGGSVTSAPGRDAGYLLGHSALEHRRLLIQASYVRPWTARFLRRAGLSQGMSVLDIGSGLGDVSFIAAEIVGPGGRVVGVERDPVAVEAARRRAEAGGYADTVRFENSDLADFSAAKQFDALAGRFILQYLPDPAAALNRLACFLRPGGIVVMHDMDVSNPDVSFPPCQTWNDCYAVLGQLSGPAGSRRISGGISPAYSWTRGCHGRTSSLVP